MKHRGDFEIGRAWQALLCVTRIGRALVERGKPQHASAPSFDISRCSFVGREHGDIFSHTDQGAVGRR
ncbi:hypothetical protein ACQKWADRAFT_292107 [Trichoderma austrokoningii]